MTVTVTGPGLAMAGPGTDKSRAEAAAIVPSTAARRDPRHATIAAGVAQDHRPIATAFDEIQTPPRWLAL